MALATNALKDVMARRDLSRETTEQLFGELMDGQLSPVVKSALLAALATKGEAASEIAGAATAMILKQEQMEEQTKNKKKQRRRSTFRIRYL